MTLLIRGAPRTKKNHGRRIKRGRRIFHVPSEGHEAWASAAILQLTAQMRERDVIDWDVNVRALIYRDARRGDAVGYYQAIADILERGGVLVNDVCCVSWDGSRLLKDADDPRVEITLTLACS